MRVSRGARVLAALVSFGLCHAVQSEDTSAEEMFSSERPVRCLHLYRIKRIEIVDKETILFHMLGGETYINRLKHPCPGLSRNKPIMYRTSLNKLCDLDIITVLEQGGFGFLPGASCGLGGFEQLEKITPPEEN